jgi:hypothetical protein
VKVSSNPRKRGDDLFELGKSYFNDLINTSLVQPVFNNEELDVRLYGCRVHDMILDLICSLSREEKIVTTSDDIDQVMASERKKFRRIYRSTRQLRGRKKACHK